MTTVGVRDLKAHLSEYLARAEKGESVMVTDRGRPVAMVGPLSSDLRAMEELKRSGILKWGGGKPKGIQLTGKRKRGRTDPRVAGAVVENRER